MKNRKRAQGRGTVVPVFNEVSRHEDVWRSGELRAPPALPLGEKVGIPTGQETGWAPEPVSTQ
jgi:hypothetical protein